MTARRVYARRERRAKTHRPQGHSGGVLVAGGATLVTLGFLLGDDESGGPPAASVQVVASPTGLGFTGTF